MCVMHISIYVNKYVYLYINTGSSGHPFSADNPYGKKAEGDKRQFSR
jgi:hypothetical protein